MPSRFRFRWVDFRFRFRLRVQNTPLSDSSTLTNVVAVAMTVQDSRSNATVLFSRSQSYHIYNVELSLKGVLCTRLGSKGQTICWTFNVKKILAVINAIYAVAKRKPEKIRLAGDLLYIYFCIPQLKYSVRLPASWCRWVLTRTKQLSKAATARVIWLCACVRYWPYHGVVLCDHCFQMVYFEPAWCLKFGALR